MNKTKKKTKTRIPLATRHPDGMLEIIHFRTGSLGVSAFAYCRKHNITPSQLGQMALAKFLDRPAPVFTGRLKNLKNIKELDEAQLSEMASKHLTRVGI